MSTTQPDSSSIHVRFLHFLAFMKTAFSSLLAGYSFYVCQFKDYSDYPAVNAVGSSWDAKWNAKRVLLHSEMSYLTQIALLWAGLALVSVALCLGSYYVMKGGVRPGDRKIYDKTFTIYIICVMLPLVTAFLMYNNMPYISRS